MIGHGWKLGFALLTLALLLSRGVSQANAPQPLPQRTLAGTGSAGPTIVGCAALMNGTTTWDATGSPYILPWNDPTIPSTDTTRQPNCTTTDSTGKTVGADVEVGPGASLVIDGSKGPVQVFSHGAGVVAAGGQIQTTNTSGVNFVSFDASPDAASWDGLSITTGGSDANGQPLRGTGQLNYTSIQHALTGIQINSGATSLPGGYGLAFTNGAVGPSYFDGIDATNTPVQLTGQGDGEFGTLNNIGSQGLKVTFDPSLPNYPSSVTRPLDLENMVFGSSVPFGQTLCLPGQTCAEGTIGNDAVQGTFTGQTNVVIAGNTIARAGSFGVHLENANHPQITNNTFVCNGSGSPTPITSCAVSGSLPTFSAIYLNGVTANLQPPTTGQTAVVSGNQGQQNGLDAIVLSGDVTSDINWITPSNEAAAPPAAPHALGYVVANIDGTGSLQLHGGNLTVASGDVVKVKGGGITLNGGALVASGSGSAPKTFTSLRDNTVGIQACPSVFVQSCPPVLPTSTAAGLAGGEWTGIDLEGATGNLVNTNLLFATKAVTIEGSPAPLLSGFKGGAYGLLINQSHIGPTFSDSVASAGVPIDVESTSFCRVDTAATIGNLPNPNLGKCVAGIVGADAGPGDHGINADFTAAGTGGSGLVLNGNDFRGSKNEAVLASGLAGRPVVIQSNTVETAGASGMQLIGADNLTLVSNLVQGSGTGSPVTYPAIYLNGVRQANFVTPSGTCNSSCIKANSGANNGLDAIALHGTTASSLTWLSPANASSPAPLGYLLDDDLTVNGDLTLAAHDILEAKQGTVTVNGVLSSTGALLTSMKQGASNLPAGFPAIALPTCGSVFDPRNVSSSGTSCSAPAPGDWNGVVLNGHQPNLITNSHIDFAGTAVTANGPLSLANGDINHSAQNGVVLGTAAATISGGSISDTGREAILATGITAAPVSITGVAIDSAGSYGIKLLPSAPATLNNAALTLTGNVISRSGLQAGGPYPAILLGGLSNGNLRSPSDAPVANSIQGNGGWGNGLDALAFQGSLTNNLDWISPRNTGALHPLGYLLTGTLDMGGKQLTVRAGDVVKVAAGAGINLSGGTLDGVDTSASSAKVFTSLSDNSAGVVACPSVLVSDCTASKTNYWSGILLGGSGANGSLVNASVRNASTPISITSQAGSTIGSSSFGLQITRSIIGPATADAIDTTGTSISVTDSTITGAVHGLVADFTPASSTAPTLMVTGNRFTGTTAEAILGEGLAGRAVWISDNHVQLGADTFGIRLLNADALVLRNNNVTTNPPVTSATEVHYPAIYLGAVTGDFMRDIRGNVGSGDGLDAIVLHGTAQGDMRWVSPANPLWAGGPSATHPLGYVLDGPLTVNAGTLTIPSGSAGAIVESLGGPITLNGGSLDASDSGLKTFTSVNDGHAPVVSCPSFLGACGARPGDWGGLVITKSLSSSTAIINKGLITYATTGIDTDAGPNTASMPNVRITQTTVLNTLKDGISAFDTPIDVEGSYVGDSTLAPGVPVPVNQPNIGGRGIIASYFSPPQCPSTCQVLTLKNNHVAWTAMDGIAANGVGGEGTDIEQNVIGHGQTYGIRLVGADQVTLAGNTISSTGTGSPRYPAIYLNGIKADLNAALQTNQGKLNGLDAIVFHGEATNGLTWKTAAALTSTGPLGYLLDNGLTVDGTLTTATNDVVKVMTGSIKINPLNGSGGVLNAAGATVFTGLSDPSYGLVACGSIFIPGACVPTNHDWAGINIDAGPSTFKDSTILHASSGITINNAPLQVSGATFVGIHGTALSSSGLQSSLTVSCSSIRQNGTGIQADYATVNDSDIYGNTVDLSGNSNLHASHDDFLGNPPQPTGAAISSSPLTSQNPVASLQLGGSNELAAMDHYGNDAFGIGTLTLSSSFNRLMRTDAPSGQFGLYNPITNTFIGPAHPMSSLGLVNNGWSANTWTPATYQPFDQTSAQAGENQMGVTGARDCIPPEIDGPAPNPNSNLMTPATKGFSAALLPTILTPAAASGFYGGSVNLSANLIGNGTAAASEKLTFQVPGQSGQTATTNGSGNASVLAALGTLAANQPHTYQVSYAGNPDLFFTPAPAAGASPITAALTVQPAGTATSTPTTSASSTTYGQAVTFKATVTTTVSGGIDPGAADGSVVFAAGSTPLCSSALGTGSSSNEAKCTTSTIPAAATAYAVHASFVPVLNGNFIASTSTSTVSQTVSQASTSTGTPTSTANPSSYGASITLKAQVTSSDLNPTGSDGSVDFKEGATTICSAGLGASSNEADCVISTLPQGVHTITATFVPANGNYGGSTSASSLAQTVNAAATTTSAPSSSLNPSTTADLVTLSATVTATTLNPGLGDGSVAFMEGATTLCTANLASDGTASCTYTFPTAGTHTVKAVFTPANTNYLTSTSSTSLTQTVS